MNTLELMAASLETTLADDWPVNKPVPFTHEVIVDALRAALSAIEVTDAMKRAGLTEMAKDDAYVDVAAIFQAMIKAIVAGGSE